MNPKLIIIIFCIALATIFIIQNADVVELRFLLWTITMSRALMYTLLLLIGIAAGWLLRSYMLHKTQNK